MIRTHNQENTQPENMCDIVFEKAKGRGGTVNRMSDYAQAAIRRVLLKRCYEKFRENSTLLKTRLKRRCFLVNFAKFVRTRFLQSTTG